MARTQETDNETDGGRTNATARDPFRSGIDRRRVLHSSATIGATATLAGCLSEASGQRAPTVYVFNTGDRTLSLIDADTDELIETVFIGTTASFPANQYGTGVDSTYDTLWLNVSGGVKALDQQTVDEVATIETGFEPNYPNLTPDENHLLVASGGTTTLEPDPADPDDHVLVRIDADRGSDTFGEVTGELEVGYAGPCDMTLTPDGEYAFVPNIADETISVVRVDPFEIVRHVDVGDPAGRGNVLPFMATASFDGEYLLVENGEGELGPDPAIQRDGSESIWDISTPEQPVELERITRDDGLPAPPITSEIGPDSDVAYLFTPAADAVTVIDLEERAVVRDIDVGGSAIAGAWGPSRETLYVPVQTANHVAVIDHAQREVLTTIETGESPTGAVGGMVRPETTSSQRVRSSLASLGLTVGEREPTFCPDDNCYCG
ncbi:hypothetical protein [Natronorubrum sp. A-ect3]|uniref:hypothetical protein n=1 Tax=Natronorubrum sp. A-ect3 TaxID=3242698 RepID=UPI00359EEB44